MPPLPLSIAPDTLRFGPDARFELNLRQRSLRIGDEAAAIGSRAFDLLAVLVERRAGVVSKGDLLDLVWPGVAVEEGNLHVQVSSLRKLLGAGAIATVPGRGYRFTEAVDAGPATAADEARAGRAPAPAPTTQPLRTNLPAHPPTLIGRGADLTALGTLLDASALVTMVGSGGVGKTSLAQALLHQQRSQLVHGVCWVELSPVTDAAGVPGAVAAALGVHAAHGPAMPTLIAALAPLSVLIALDNAEHLVDAVAAFARALRAGAPQLRLLVTSQIPLRVAGERLYRVAPLGLPAPAADPAIALQHGAVALFVERVQALDRHFVLDAGNVAAVVQICRRLDGLALAIELAAARVPLLGLAQLAQALDQRLRVLTTGLRGAPARQRTLRAALEWSHGFLTPAEQAVFRRLAVFVGSTTLGMLQQVAAEEAGGPDAWDVLEALAVLVERSLVVVVDAEPPRYRLLESPRSHALDCLAAAGESAAMRQRHALALADRLAAAYPARWDGSIGVDAWRAALEPDLDNAREAFAWACIKHPATALEIAGPLLWAVPLALWSERMALCDAAEALLSDPINATVADDAVRARAWLAIASARMRTRNRQGMVAAQQALALFSALGDARGRYLALACLIDAAARATELAQADAALGELHALADAAWPPQLLLIGAEAEAMLSMRHADRVRNLHLRHRALALQRAAAEDDSGNIGNLIDAQLTAGLVDDAVRDGQALVARLHGSRQERELAFARLNLLAAALCQGDLALARRAGEAGWRQASRFELQPYFADHLALLCALEGRPRAAARLIGFADAGHLRMDDPREPNEAAACARAEAMLQAALTGPEIARLRAEGHNLDDHAVAALGFSPHD